MKATPYVCVTHNQWRNSEWRVGLRVRTNHKAEKRSIQHSPKPDFKVVASRIIRMGKHRFTTKSKIFIFLRYYTLKLYYCTGSTDEHSVGLILILKLTFPWVFKLSILYTLHLYMKMTSRAIGKIGGKALGWRQLGARHVESWFQWVISQSLIKSLS